MASKLKFPKTIKWIITDFDGIVTDNCVYVTEDRKMSRKLNFKDVMAFSLAGKNGINIGIISGEDNSAIDIIDEKFSSVKEIHKDIRQKLEVLQGIVEKYSLTPDEFIYMGDDVNDFLSLEYAKHKVTVPSAVEKIKKIRGIKLTASRGGDGAFREVVDAVIEAIS